MRNLLEKYKILEINNLNYILKYNKNSIELHFKNIYGTEYNPYPIQDDNNNYIYGFANRIVNLKDKRILVAGLGLGLIPFYLQDNCDIIDIVEIDIDLINIIKNQPYLSNKVKIYNGDITNINLTEKYDLIIIDIFWEVNEKILSEIELVLNNVTKFLVNDGTIYVPIIDMIKNY